MYAIVDIAGQQFKVEKDQKIFVHRLDGEEGSSMFFEKVLLIDDGKKVIVGTPVITDAVVSAKILSHPKGDKVLIFKKKRRKGYQILKGHRQMLTEVQVSDILEKGGSKLIKEESAKKTSKGTAAKEKKVKTLPADSAPVEKEISAPVSEAPETPKEKAPAREKEGKKAAPKTEKKGKVTGKGKATTEKKSEDRKTAKAKPATGKKDKAKEK